MVQLRVADSSHQTMNSAASAASTPEGAAIQYTSDSLTFAPMWSNNRVHLQQGKQRMGVNMPVLFKWQDRRVQSLAGSQCRRQAQASMRLWGPT